MPLFAQKPRDERALRAHRPRGAEFLAAEAPDTFLPVDHGVLVHDRDRARRTEPRAVAAAGAADSWLISALVTPVLLLMAL